MGTTGGGASGKYGTATLQGNLARLGALSNVDTSFGQTAATLPLNISQLAANLLGLNFGQTTTSSGSSTGSGSQSGFNWGASIGGPGAMLGGGGGGGGAGLMYGPNGVGFGLGPG